MKVVKPSVEIMDVFDGLDVIRKLELCGRVCYKSEHKMNDAIDALIGGKEDV